MPKTNVPLIAFNRGLVSSSALARVDVERVRLSAEEMTNWLPKTQGSMLLRPGFGYIGTSRSNAKAIYVPFVAATDDTALIEITASHLRVWVDDELVTRVSVTTSVSNSTFSSSSNWTDTSTNGGTVSFGGSGLVLDATNVGGVASVQQQVTCSGANISKRHALDIVVARGPVTFRCGSSSGGDEYITETTLRTGYHSLAFTPTGDFYVQFANDLDIDKTVTSCQVASAGTMDLTTPWAEADLPNIRWDQSADVLFAACEGIQQRRIERRAADSWSITTYQSDTGPFFATRSARVRMKVAATYGNTTLTSDKPFFKSSHVGAIFRLFNDGVKQQFRLAGDGSFTEPFKVTGVYDAIPSKYNDRNWSYQISGTWSGTLRILRAFDDEEFGYKRYVMSYPSDTSLGETSNTAGYVGNQDIDQNAIVYYKIGFEASDYTSGVAVIDIDYDGGGGYGVCRVTGYTSSTQVSVEVLDKFNSTDYTSDWQEGVWSGYRGWPSAVAFHRGRLWWAGKTRFIGSVSDDYENFDPEYEGDAGPINRTLGTGPVDTINFALSLGRLVIGTPGAEFSIKSTSFEEPLTPQNTQASDPSTQGSRQGVAAAKVDNRGVFAQRSGRRLFEFVFNSETYDYEPRDLTLLAPEITGTAKVVGMTVQRQPDTRIHVWLDDGSVILLTYEPSEEVVCWSRIAIGGDGFVESIVVLPGEDEDQVYYSVKRTVNSSTVRYLEKMAQESECVGGTTSKLADSFIVVSSVTGTSVTGLSHLEGKSVVAWGGGADLGTYTVASGAITLSASVTSTDVMVGLPYTATFKSTKLAYAAAAGTALTQKKRVGFVGVIMRNTHNDGLEFGRDFTTMDGLPRIKDGLAVGTSDVFSEYDQPAFEFPGEWDTDSRLCLRAASPRPCELLCAVISVETNDRY